ncbi:hypothetical protein PIB30_072108 [Stylosanthes scabra]|uniref:Uncharacterized protein n=1 Tax=Stylosanthes scabra TaxID=79078 RepID=A0ABU6QP05_9FABA|nr:hypothetical protein [Stylosanthes scabra]
MASSLTTAIHHHLHHFTHPPPSFSSLLCTQPNHQPHITVAPLQPRLTTTATILAPPLFSSSIPEAPLATLVSVVVPRLFREPPFPLLHLTASIHNHRRVAYSAPALFLSTLSHLVQGWLAKALAKASASIPVGSTARNPSQPLNDTYCDPMCWDNTVN